jgi:hypothetical protein
VGASFAASAAGGGGGVFDAEFADASFLAEGVPDVDVDHRFVPMM